MFEHGLEDSFHGKIEKEVRSKSVGRGNGRQRAWRGRSSGYGLEGVEAMAMELKLKDSSKES